MNEKTLTDSDKKALSESLSHINALLHELNHDEFCVDSPEDPFLLGACEYTKKGRLIRKKFGEYMVIFTFSECRNEDNEILRVFCAVTKEGDFVRLFHNYISQEQADLIRGE